MTFVFRDFSGSAVRPHFLHRPAGRRARLVARWVRNANGQLECRWERASFN